ncbi:hypothetical protein P879_03944 [Paragonimus westermani]|uniref:Uncharacterized protein n=1 Tax=Paragonimus westermani TaxID=34504 RepID=A0A8T0DMR8_9TREM|nr:hypothetical protein P879_03944 [Paragonimus westermani]
MFADTKEVLADNIYKYLKEFYQYEDEQYSNNLADREAMKSKAINFEKELQLDDNEKLMEKLKYMSIDNCRLREKIALLSRYENEYLKEILDDRKRDLKLVKSSESRQREDLAYLKEVTKMQKMEIDNLVKCLDDVKSGKHRTSNQSSTEQTEDLPSNTSVGKTFASSSAGELPAWMQSVRSFFKGNKSAA